VLILDWTDENKHPDLRIDERIMGVLYQAGIADLNALEAITGWEEAKVRRAIRTARERAVRRLRHAPSDASEEEKRAIREERRKAREERDKWILIQKTALHGPNYYSLGPKGFAYICELLGESVGNRKPPSSQIKHFRGINDILIRLLNAGIRPVWYSTREATSWLIHSIKSRTVRYDSLQDRYVVQTKRSPYTINPDAMVQLPDGRSYILEYETGATHGAKAEGKFLGYLDLHIGANVQIPPVVFVTPRENVSKLERARDKAIHREEYEEVDIRTDFYILEEGEETRFLLEEPDAIEIRGVEPPEPEDDRDPDTPSPADPEELSHLRQRIEELEEQLKNKDEDLTYWVKKNSALRRLAAEQEQWMDRLVRHLSSKLMARGALEDFEKKNPRPKRLEDFEVK